MNGYICIYSAILTKGNNFSDFLFASVDGIPLPKCGLALKERFSLLGATVFLPDVTYTKKGDKKK